MFDTIEKNFDSSTGWPARALPEMGEMAGVSFVLALLVVGLQLRLHCYSADFGDDDASHYISGLAIYNYLISGFHSSPLAFIKSFHSHYPLVGIGHWGPLYYFVEAIWMLIFSTSLSSVLALSATVTIVTALGIYAWARQTAGRCTAFFVAVAFVLVPLIEGGTSELMIDIPVGLLCLGAGYAYACYLESERIRHSVAFALIASAALLIKGNAACLALLPPAAILIAWRLDLLRKFSFWLPMPIVALLVGPWYALTYGKVAAGFRYEWGDYVATAVVANSAYLFDAVGPVVLAAAFLGMGATITRAWKGRMAPLPSVACALLLADWAFQSVAPADIQARYLAPLLPPLLLLAADGVMIAAAWLKQYLPWRMPVTEAGLTSLLVLSIVPAAIAVPAKPSLGFMVVAPMVWRQLPPNNRAVLIASNGVGEAAAIAALAMYDPHCPSLFVVRGSRLLGGGGYNNEDYKPRLATGKEVTAEIDAYAIPLVLFHPNFPHSTPWVHVNQVAEAVRLNPGRWDELFSVPSIASNIVLFGIRGNGEKPLESQRLMALSAPRSLNGIGQERSQ